MTKPLRTKKTLMPIAESETSSGYQAGEPPGKGGMNVNPWLTTTHSAATARMPVRLGMGACGLNSLDEADMECRFLG
jgi:hypothetical protein